MNTCLIAYAAAFLLALVGSGLALLLGRLAIGAARQNTSSAATLQLGMEAIAARVENLEQQCEAIRRQAPEGAPDGGRAALNLNKRSQVLRMNRRGDSAERIATVLEVPRQEVDLLIKVHRMIIGRL